MVLVTLGFYESPVGDHIGLRDFGSHLWNGWHVLRGLVLAVVGLQVALAHQ